MDGRTWSLSEVPEFGSNMIYSCPFISDQWLEPPAVVRQHASCQRSFVALSSQVGRSPDRLVNQSIRVYQSAINGLLATSVKLIHLLLKI